MNGKVKVVVIIAVALVLVGLAIGLISLASLRHNPPSVASGPSETNSYTVTQDFSDISIADTVCDIRFAPSEDGKCRVVCVESRQTRHEVAVKDGCLTVNLKHERKWHGVFSPYEVLGNVFQQDSVTVYLPETEYGDLNIITGTSDVLLPAGFTFASVDIYNDTGDVNSGAAVTGGLMIESDTGHITVDDTSAQNVELSTDTGKVALSRLNVVQTLTVVTNTGDIEIDDADCSNFVGRSDTGDLELKRLIAAGAIAITTNTGDVTFHNCDAGSVQVETDTGDVSGSFSSDKIFYPQSDTGRIEVPKSTSGGLCEITTDTGDIELTIE